MAEVHSIEEYARRGERAINWVTLLLFGGGGAAALAYVPYLFFLGLVRWRDAGSLALLLLFAVGGLWVGLGPVLNRRAREEEAVAFLRRPREDIVWFYVQQSRTNTMLIIGAIDGTKRAVSLGGAMGRLVDDAERGTILAEAMHRWPLATAGFSAQHQADYTADPSRLRRNVAGHG